MRGRFVNVALLGVLATAILSTPVPAQTLISNVQVTELSFSPNGDGVEDSTVITYTLADTAIAVHVIVLLKDSSTVVDTLVGGLSQGPATSTPVTWHGTFADGSPAPEDSCLIFVRAVGLSSADSTTRWVTVDNTAPTVVITNLFPFLFGPGSPDPQSSQLTASYDIADALPSETVTVRSEMFGPGDNVNPIQTFRDSLFAANSSLTDVWDGGTASADGFHEIRVTVGDQAGNVSSTFSTVNVDLDAPDIAVTSLQAGDRLQASPDSLFGWAFDRNSIDSLFVRYSASGPFEPVASIKLIADTLFFAVPLIDSLTADGTYPLRFRALDPLGRQTSLPFAITIDSTSPSPPNLHAAPSPTQDPTFTLDADVSTDTNVMRIFRNGVMIDTIFPNLPGTAKELPRVVPLLPGANQINAAAVDAAGNTSGISNTLLIVFNDATALVMPQPFTPGNTFRINLPRPATVTLRLFDLGGHLVATLPGGGAATSIGIVWDGLNGDNDPVDMGPLVAVANIRYVDGGKEVFRELFLFSP